MNILFSNLKRVNFLSFIIIPVKSAAPIFPKLSRARSRKILPLLRFLKIKKLNQIKEY